MSFIINSYRYAGFTGLLDSYGSATVAYSLRRLSSTYTSNLIRIREDGSQTETDIGYDANGDLDTAAISSHCGANNGFVTKVYDQSGGVNHLVQATAANQAQIYNGSVTLTDPNNGNPAMLFNGTSHFFSLTSTVAVTQNYFQLFVFNRPSAATISTGLAATAGNPYPFLWFTDNAIYSGTETTTSHDTAQTSTGDFIHTTVRDGSSNVKMWRNGVAGTTKTNTGTSLSFGYAFNRNGNHHNGYGQELVFWNSDQESNQSGIEGDANTYWGVF